MCLFTKHETPEVALMKLPVYKILILYRGGRDEEGNQLYSYTAHFNNYTYQKGLNYPIRLSSEDWYYNPKDAIKLKDKEITYSVDVGWLHAFTDEMYAYRVCDCLKKEHMFVNYVVVKMYIPENAKYFLSTDNKEVCADCLEWNPKYE